MSLDEYRAKRDFLKTAEPQGGDEGSHRRPPDRATVEVRKAKRRARDPMAGLVRGFARRETLARRGREP